MNKKIHTGLFGTISWQTPYSLLSTYKIKVIFKTSMLIVRNDAQLLIYKYSMYSMYLMTANIGSYIYIITTLMTANLAIHWVY